MGRSYWFECEKCGYRAKVSGRADRGLNLFVQTIVCRDCRELYDAVTRMRVPEGSQGVLRPSSIGMRSFHLDGKLRSNRKPPTFQAAASRLLYTGHRRFKWIQFQLQCPVSAAHRIQMWNEPNKCPRCGLHLEKNAIPFRIWD